MTQSPMGYFLFGCFAQTRPKKRILDTTLVLARLSESSSGGGKLGAFDKVLLVFLRQVFEREALGLGKEEGREDTGQHE